MPKLIRAGAVHALFFILVGFAFHPSAMAQEVGKKLALVIGNSKYESAGPLPNGVRDAAAFHAFLTTNGFQSTLILDGNRRTLAEAMSKFSRELQPQDTALFYFAGHGMQMQGENYLLGTEAKLASEFDVQGETLALSDLIGSIERRAKIALIFIDACRNNPLADRLNAEIEGKSRAAATRGLAPIHTSGAGTMVAFAAAPGQLAYDGAGNNSPFTKALIDNLAQPGLEVGTAFKRVIRQVRLETQDKQSPQILSSLALEFYFGDENATASGGGDFLAEIDYGKAERISTVRAWKQFLNKYPTGEHAQLARQALVELEGDKPVRRVSPAEAEKKLNLNTAQRKEIQLALVQLGYDIGSADGSFGKQTRREIARYQKALGLPETGFLTEITAARLNIPVATAEDEIYSAEEARPYNVDDLRGLETDERIIRAVACLRGYEITYGIFSGNLYVAVYSGGIISREAAQRVSVSCGCQLVSISSKAENDFVANLFNKDIRMFNILHDNNESHKMGPWIGLIQDPVGREPRGGWKWADGTPVTYSAWAPGLPNEYRTGDDYGMYYARVSGTVDMKDFHVETWDDMGPSDATYSFVLEFE